MQAYLPPLLALALAVLEHAVAPLADQVHKYARFRGTTAEVAVQMSMLFPCVPHLGTCSTALAHGPVIHSHHTLLQSPSQPERT